MKAAVGSALAFALDRASDSLITCDDLTVVGYTRTQASAKLSAWYRARYFAVVDRDGDTIYRIAHKGRVVLEQIRNDERAVKDDSTVLRWEPDFFPLITCLRTLLPSTQLEREATYLELCR